MNFEKTEIPCVLLMTPKVFKDQRGYLFESFSQRELDQALGYGVDFIQEIECEESQGFSAEFNADAYRIVSCTKGSIEVRITDDRLSNSTISPLNFLIDDVNHQSIFVPKGCKLIFRVVSEKAIVSIRHSEVL